MFQRDKYLFQKTLDPTVSDRVRMVATVLSGKDLALEVRAGLKRKVRSQRAVASENLVLHNLLAQLAQLTCRWRRSRTMIPISSQALSLSR